jgi:hypothetical protein
LYTIACGGVTTNLTANSIFVGSTPGNELIKSPLTIHPDKKIDFIRWNLELSTKSNQKNGKLTAEIYRLASEKLPHGISMINKANTINK